MTPRTGLRILTAISTVILVACGAAQSFTTPTPTPTSNAPANLPVGVTAAMWTEGKSLFAANACVTCHGPGGKNGPYGPDLTDNVFLHNSGAYEEIVTVITTGVPVSDFKSPTSQKDFFMLPRGGVSLTDAQIRSIAAYVWSLSHPG